MLPKCTSLAVLMRQIPFRFDKKLNLKAISSEMMQKYDAS